MSRSGYCDDLGSEDPWALIRYRGAVKSAIRGSKGQSLIRDLIAALDAMPEKKLIAHDLETPEGSVCALGAVAKVRGIDVTRLDPEDAPAVAAAFGIAESLAREVVYENDEGGYYGSTPEGRWTRMRLWAEGQLREAKP